MAKIRRQQLFYTSLILGIVAVLASLYHTINKLRRKKEQNYQIEFDGTLNLVQLTGLSEAEAKARLSSDLVEERESKARQVRRDIWRSSSLSIFNLSLLGLSVTQLLLNDLLGAALTIFVLIVNIISSAGQQLYATKKVEQLLESTRPLLTVIRDGRIQSVDSDAIVVGDLLIVGPGDTFLADGKLISGRPRVIESMNIAGHEREIIKSAGDFILSGTHCLEGRAVYEMTALPNEHGFQRWTPVQKKSERTPLQRIMTRVFRTMLVFIAIFLIILILDLVRWPHLASRFEFTYRQASSILFSIAPSSLFFMIVATYAIGSAQLGKMGALVRDSRAVEGLAQVSVLCFSKVGALTGASVNLEMIPTANGRPSLAESQIRQVLADFAHTIEHGNVFLQAIAENSHGSNRPVSEIAPYLSAYGWSAVTYSGADNRGTYVIGEPAVLEGFLIVKQENVSEAVEPTLAESQKGWRKAVDSFRNLLIRDDTKLAARSDDDTNNASRFEETKNVDDETVSGPREEKRGIVQRMRRRVAGLGLPASEEKKDEPRILESRPQLMFAYWPDPVPLFENGQPQLTAGLIPLCTLNFEEQLRPESREAVQAFSDSGVAVKILSSADPARVLAAAEQLGLNDADDGDTLPVSGPQLSEMNEDQFNQAISEATLFGHLTRQQKSHIVRTLRRQGERVAMVGDWLEDVEIMQEANLRISHRSSSQATVNVADIILLKDSLQVLPTVLRRGQRLVNGMLDILKINLVRIGYVLLLIIAMFLAGKRTFFYVPAQGGAITFFTVIIPSLGLTLWSSAGSLPRQYMRSRIWHFVVPAVLTITAAGLVLSWIFDHMVNDFAQVQVAVTHGLISLGLLLVIFVQPPARFWVGGDVLSDNRRNTYLVITLFFLFMAASFIPLTQEIFRIQTLGNIKNYLVIAVVVIVWLFIVRTIWRTRWLNRYVGILSDRLEV